MLNGNITSQNKTTLPSKILDLLKEKKKFNSEISQLREDCESEFGGFIVDRELVKTLEEGKEYLRESSPEGDKENTMWEAGYLCGLEAIDVFSVTSLNDSFTYIDTETGLRFISPGMNIDALYMDNIISDVFTIGSADGSRIVGYMTEFNFNTFKAHKSIISVSDINKIDKYKNLTSNSEFIVNPNNLIKNKTNEAVIPF